MRSKPSHTSPEFNQLVERKIEIVDGFLLEILLDYIKPLHYKFEWGDDSILYRTYGVNDHKNLYDICIEARVELYGSSVAFRIMEFDIDFTTTVISFEHLEKILSSFPPESVPFFLLLKDYLISNWALLHGKKLYFLPGENPGTLLNELASWTELSGSTTTSANP